MKRLLSVVPACLAVFVAASFGASAGAGAGSARTLKGAVPAWWTPQLRARVLAAGPPGIPAPPEARAGIPASSLAFTGIRPGELIILDDGKTTSLCTTNFVFTSGGTLPGPIPLSGTPSASRSTNASRTKGGDSPKKSSTQAKAGKPAGSGSTLFIGTAGHCGVNGTDVFMVFVPPPLSNPVLTHVGKIVKSVAPPIKGSGLNETFDPSATDFALIGIEPALNAYVSPSMAYVGGPTGIYTPPNNNTVTPILHAGWGLVIGTGGTPRAGLAYLWNAGSEYRFEGAVTPGDSGSGAIVPGGLAAGNITHIISDLSQSVPVWNGGTTMAAILRALGNSYTLATCSLAIPWPLPGCPPV